MTSHLGFKPPPCSSQYSDVTMCEYEFYSDHIWSRD